MDAHAHVRRFACIVCRQVWRQDTSRVAQRRTRLTRPEVEFRLRAVALQCMSVSRVASALGLFWHIATNAVLAIAQATLLDILATCPPPPSRLMIPPACFAPVREVPVTLLMVPGGPGLGQLLWAWASCPRLLMIRGPYVWSRAKRGDKYVTVIIGLPRTRPQWSGPRLWDVAPPRSKKILKTRSALPGPARTG